MEEHEKRSGPATRDAAIRLTMMPRDTNAHGTVFGGIILSYIDVAGGVEACGTPSIIGSSRWR